MKQTLSLYAENVLYYNIIYNIHYMVRFSDIIKISCGFVHHKYSLCGDKENVILKELNTERNMVPRITSILNTK